MHTLRPMRLNFFLVLPCIQLFLCVVTVADPIFYNCSGGSYSQKSQFATNLDQLLSDLTSKSQQQSFDNVTFGQEANRVYGLFQCRGDISPQECRTCIKPSRIEIKQACPNSTQAIVWYNACLLRHSDQYLFGLVDGPEFYIVNC